MRKTSILIIDDEPLIRSSLTGLLSDMGYEADAAESGRKGVEEYNRQKRDIVLLDVMLPDTSGVDVLKEILILDSDAKVIMMSGQADIATAVTAISTGALNFLEKPLNPDQLVISIEDTVKRIRLERKVSSLEEIVDSEYRIVGNSAPIKSLLEIIKRTGQSEAKVLIFGENGSGKELVARAIHKESSRRDGPFISLNCAAVPENLVESELFGYEKGAFTGAVKQKKGRMEEADGGTLFLDEVGDMNLITQAKLLRVLETNEAVRVGGTKSFSFDVRIIAATNKNLEKEISKNNFREDLFYRLNVVPVTVPALRERREDIPVLAEYFLQKIIQKSGKGMMELDKSATDVLSRYSWPGNVRELKNLIERIVILSDDKIIGEETVRRVLPEIQSTGTSEHVRKFRFEQDKPLREIVGNFEREIIEQAFNKCNGNISQLAKMLKTDRANLYRKLRNYGIK